MPKNPADAQAGPLEISGTMRFARLISNILNPFVVGLAAILVLSLESTSSPADAIIWLLILMAVSLLPVLSAAVYLARTGRMDGVITATRRQRYQIYLLSTIISGVGYVVLHYTGAPLMLRAAFIGGAAGAVLFTAINLWWKISLHSAFAAALTSILVLLHGVIGLLALVPALLIAWSRFELRQHSAAQIVAGIVLASLIAVIIFHAFGLD
jgi:hypothetical protein